MANKEKIILDTDIGSDIDDSLALAYLLNQPSCELLGITTVSGKADLRAQMVSTVCRNAGRGDIPIHVGCHQGIFEPIRQKGAGQTKALGDWDRQINFPPVTAVEFMRQTIRANPGEITLLAIGPMTNVALLFATDPDLPAMLKQLVLMCGWFFGQGGEWNAINDPLATAITYGMGPQTKPTRHVSFGLDVTCKCVMNRDQCREKFTAKVLEPVRGFAEVWFERYENVTFHDPLAAACIFQPDICTYRPGEVRVSLAEPTKGWTIFKDVQENPPHLVAAGVDSTRFFEHYFSVVR